MTDLLRHIFALTYSEIRRELLQTSTERVVEDTFAKDRDGWLEGGNATSEQGNCIVLPAKGRVKGDRERELRDTPQKNPWSRSS